MYDVWISDSQNLRSPAFNRDQFTRNGGRCHYLAIGFATSVAERPFSSPPCRIREAAKSRKGMEQELAHAVNSSSLALSEVLACKNSSGAPEVRVGSSPMCGVEGLTCGLGTLPGCLSPEPWLLVACLSLPAPADSFLSCRGGGLQLISRSTAVEVSVSVKALCTETQAFLEGKQVSTGQKLLEVPACPTQPLPSLGAKAAPLNSLSHSSWILPIKRTPSTRPWALSARSCRGSLMSTGWPLSQAQLRRWAHVRVGAASQKATAATCLACDCFSLQEPTGCLGRRPPESPGQLLASLVGGSRVGRLGSRGAGCPSQPSGKGSRVTSAIATAFLLLPWQSPGKGGRERRVSGSASSSFSFWQVMGQEVPGSSNKGSLKLRINLAKPKKEKLQKQRSGGFTPGNLAVLPDPRRAGRGISASE